MTASSAPCLANRRHDLDADAVAREIARKVAKLEDSCREREVHSDQLAAKYAQDVANGVAQKNWIGVPWAPPGVRQYYADCIRQEQCKYAKVRVIELPKEGRRFVLVYGDADDALVASGTGPFETLEEAGKWFLRGGR